MNRLTRQASELLDSDEWIARPEQAYIDAIDLAQRLARNPPEWWHEWCEAIGSRLDQAAWTREPGMHVDAFHPAIAPLVLNIDDEELRDHPTWPALEWSRLRLLLLLGESQADWSGRTALPELRRLDIRRTTAELVAWVARCDLPQLQRLTARRSGLSALGLEQLLGSAGMVGSELDVGHNELTEFVAPPESGVRSLILDDSQLPLDMGERMRCARWPLLEALSLDHIWLPGRTLLSLAEGTYPRLRRLSLTVAEIPDGLSGALLGQLSQFRLRGSRIGSSLGRLMKALEGGRLESLDLSACQLEDLGPLVTAQLPRLRRLDLRDAPTDSLLVDLRRASWWSGLRELALDGPAADMVLNDMAAFSHLDRVYLPNLDTAPAGSNVIPELPRWPVV